MSKDFNWPKKGDKAFGFVENGPYFHIPSIRTTFSPHAAAFKTAAEIVIAKCEANGDRAANDILIFPVVYLYRHGIELYLKSIIRIGVGINFFELEKVKDDFKWHNLARLWNHAKKLLLDRWSTSDLAPLKATEAVINELHQADPNGQVFRYAADNDGKPHTYEKLPDHISPAQLAKKMDGIYNFLEATWSALEDDLSNMRQLQRDWEREMEREMEREYREYP